MLALLKPIAYIPRSKYTEIINDINVSFVAIVFIVTLTRSLKCKYSFFKVPFFMLNQDVIG